MRHLTRRRVTIVLAVLILSLMAALGVGPHYCCVRVTTETETIEVEAFGFGPQRAVIELKDGRAEASSW